MNTTTNPVNEKALRRWVRESYGPGAGTWDLAECEEWAEDHHPYGLRAFHAADWTAYDAYRDASATARTTVDAVFTAVRNFTGPDYRLEVDNFGNLELSFTWHDGAKYRVKVTGGGSLERLFRLELTGGWVPCDGERVPETLWRTVRAFSRDRAGKLLAGLPFPPATASWAEAAAR